MKRERDGGRERRKIQRKRTRETRKRNIFLSFPLPITLTTFFLLFSLCLPVLISLLSPACHLLIPFHFVAGLQKLGEPFCDGYSACYLDGIFNSINVGQCSTLGQPGRAHVFPNRSVRVNAAAKAMLGERRSSPAVAGLGCAQGSGHTPSSRSAAWSFLCSQRWWS